MNDPLLIALYPLAGAVSNDFLNAL